MSETPFASIVIPTHDRASTLGLSIRSALAQDEPSIEVLVVGDGCSAACRTIARDWIARDPRVRFLDWEKAPGKGHANRDRAVREARSDRIFYNDDDDLLLPHHVSTLGRELTTCDVVDTPTVSVAPDGQIDRGVHDSADTTARAMLAGGRFKAVFDTHLAHTKSVYMRLDAPWDDGGRTSSVFDMLRNFAGDEHVRWRTVQRITALSFHGARRVTMPDWQRRAELERWLPLAISRDGEKVFRGLGSYAFHAVQLAEALRAEGFGYEGTRERLSASLAQHGGINAGQREDIETATDLVYRRTVWAPSTERVFRQLLEARYGALMPIRATVKRFRPEVGIDDLAAAIERPGLPQTPAEVLTSLLVGQRTARLPDDIRDRLDVRFATCPTVDAYGFAVEAGSIFAERQSTRAEAWIWCEAALSSAPEGPQAIAAWRLKRDLSVRTEDVTGAKAAQAEIDRLRPATDA